PVAERVRVSKPWTHSEKPAEAPPPKLSPRGGGDADDYEDRDDGRCESASDPCEGAYGRCEGAYGRCDVAFSRCRMMFGRCGRCDRCRRLHLSHRLHLSRLSHDLITDGLPRCLAQRSVILRHHLLELIGHFVGPRKDHGLVTRFDLTP